MKFGNVETNIETKEQYEKLIDQIIDWYVEKRYPGYKVVRKEKEVSQHGEVV